MLDLDYAQISQPVFDILFNPYDPDIKKLVQEIPDQKLMSMKHLINDKLKPHIDHDRIKLIES